MKQCLVSFLEPPKVPRNWKAAVASTLEEVLPHKKVPLKSCTKQVVVAPLLSTWWLDRRVTDCNFVVWRLLALQRAPEQAGYKIPNRSCPLAPKPNVRGDPRGTVLQKAEPVLLALRVLVRKT